MGAGMLTSLTSVKTYLSVTNDNSDALLTRMIKSASAMVLNYLNRNSLALAEYTEMYDGYGNNFMVLRQNPVWAVSQVSLYGVPVAAATGNGLTNPYSNGWVLEPDYQPVGAQRLNFYGRRLPTGRASIAVVYQAGFVITETQTIPDATPWQVVTNFFWLGDVSVAKASDGTLFVKVDENPVQGQYSVDANGLYTFSEDDAGEDVLITYSYVPADIENAVIEIVGERYRYMDRIGIVSKSLGGQETVSFSQKSMNDFTRDTLTPYRNVIPV